MAWAWALLAAGKWNCFWVDDNFEKRTMSLEMSIEKGSDIQSKEEDITEENVANLNSKCNVDADKEREDKKRIKRRKGITNRCRGCGSTLPSMDARLHWCKSGNCRLRRAESERLENKKRREKKKKGGEPRKSERMGDITQYHYNPQFCFKDKIEEIISNGGIIIRGFLTAEEGEMLYWLSEVEMNNAKKNKTFKTQSAKFKEYPVDTTGIREGRSVTRAVMEKVNDLVVLFSVEIFGHHPKCTLTYHQKGANCYSQQLLHADSVFQRFFKVTVQLTPTAVPIRYVPYNHLVGEKITCSSDATRKRVAERFQEMLPNPAVYNADKLYNLARPISITGLDIGDVVITLGDLIHGETGNHMSTNGRTLVVKTMGEAGRPLESIYKKQLDVWTLFAMISKNTKNDEEETRAKMRQALARHLHSNKSDGLQTKWHVTAMCGGNDSLIKTEMAMMNTIQKELKDLYDDGAISKVN